MQTALSLLLLLPLLAAGPARAATFDGLAARSAERSALVTPGVAASIPAAAVEAAAGAPDDHGGGGHRAEQPRTGIPLILLVVLLLYGAAALTLGFLRRRQV